MMSKHLKKLGYYSSFESSKRRDRDRPLSSSDEEEELLKESTTLYVSNLSFRTTEMQIYELFGRCGDIKRVIMGLDQITKTPCGFCFVEYFNREDAENAMRFIDETILDDRVIHIEWDPGFREGRQYGRGRCRGQMREEFRGDPDTSGGSFPQ